MKTIKGDLIDFAKKGEFNIIIHGCNCQHTMGSGIAKQIKEEFPTAHIADCKTPKGKDKLGTYSESIVFVNQQPLVIINAYTQDRYGQGRHLNYEAIYKVFEHIKTNYHGGKFGIPKIGAGLAGGEWSIIKKIIEHTMKDEDITLVEYDE